MPVLKLRRESHVERHLVKRVVEIGGITEKVTVLGSRGFFDRLVVLPGGNIFFVELKRPKVGRLSAQQLARHVKYRQLGANVVVLASVEAVDAWLDGIMSEG
jgi:hypothetical protein